MTDRITRINEMVRHELGLVIRREVELPPGTILTILRVTVAKDLKHAKVYVSILPENKTGTVLRLLAKNAKMTAETLNEKTILRSVLKLQFAVDDSESRAEEIDRLLDNLK